MGRLVRFPSGRTFSHRTSALDVTSVTLTDEPLRLPAANAANRAKWCDRLKQALNSLAVLDGSAAVLAAMLKDTHPWPGYSASQDEQSDRSSWRGAHPFNPRLVR
jgi:hypothetical protein